MTAYTGQVRARICICTEDAASSSEGHMLLLLVGRSGLVLILWSG